MRLKLSLIAIMGLLIFAACSNKNEESKANISVPAAVPAIVAPYDATLSEGIQFAQKPGYPKFIKSVIGMSKNELNGRWTDGKTVIFTFANPLPMAFRLHLGIAAVFGPNDGKPVKVAIGDWKGEFTVTGSILNPVDLEVKTSQPANAIEFTIPEPTSPKELKMSNDTRALGVMLKRLSIEDVAKAQ